MTETERMIKAKIPGKETGIEIRHTLCDICTGIHCGLDVYVKDGKAIKVEGTPGYPGSNGKLCTKGASNRQYLYRKNRIKTPLRRVGERGEGKFEKISWEEAYREIADRLNRLKEQYGPESVAWYTGYSKWYRAWLHRLTHSFGSLNYGAESSVCHTSTLMAWQAVAGRAFHSDLAHNSDLFIGWGCNTMVNSYQEARALFSFKERGGKIIIIDSRDTPTTQKLADIHLKVHPGTDGALAWGLANLMIENGWYDCAFVEKYVHGFEPYKKYARAFTPEETSRITGIPVSQIEEVARVYGEAKKVSTYMPSAAIAHNINGFNSLRTIISLQVITGNMDKEGGELPSFPSLCYADTGFPTMQDEFVESKRPQNCKPKIAAGKFPVWDALTDEFQIADLPRQIHEGTPYPVKAVVAFGMNHRMVPQPGRFLAAMDELDFFVAADIIMTESCRHADIVLPSCTSMERNELRGYGGGYLTCTQQCVKPLYQSKPDTEIMCDLSRYLGLDDPLMASGYEETMKYFISNLSVSLEELRDTDLPLKMPEYSPYVPGSLREKGFETPSGKLELWSELIAEVNGGREDLSPLPVWNSGFDQAPENEFPMTLIIGSRLPNVIHSRLHEELSWPRSLRKTPMADVHPKDAKSLKLQEGDWIRLFTSTGEIKVKVHITAAGLPGDVYMFHGYSEADANELVPAAHLDPYTGFPGCRQVRCMIQKVGIR